MRRLSLRTVFVVPMILCLLLWVGSYIVHFNLEHNGTAQYGVEVGSGGMYLYISDLPGKRPWVTMVRWADSRWYAIFDRRSILGFTAKPYGIEGMETGKWGFVRVPLWFLTVASAVLVWRGWRKKRRAAVNAFPIEVE